MAKAWLAWQAAWRDFRSEPEEFIEAGDKVLVRTRISGRGRGSGVEADSAAGWVFRFRGGKVVYFHAFRDPEKVFGAAGLTE